LRTKLGTQAGIAPPPITSRFENGLAAVNANLCIIDFQLIDDRAASRYQEPVTIPSKQEILARVAAADRLANSKNKTDGKDMAALPTHALPSGGHDTRGVLRQRAFHADGAMPHRREHPWQVRVRNRARVRPGSISS
jgi:hypothetical protein